MAQSLKCLSHKHEDLNLIPGANLKNKTNKQVTGVVVCGCNLHAGEAETVESLGFTGPGSLIGERRSVKLFQKSWCLKNNT